MFDRFEKFALTIAQINRYVQKIKTMEMSELGLKGNHTMCLYYLGKKNGGLTSTELCTLCKEDKAAISRTVTDLEALGFIKTDDTDGKREYRTKLHLTKKGEEAACILDTKIRNAVNIGGKNLTYQQREDFYASLDVIAENLEDYAKGKNNEHY
ncbi:MAG: MarR family transcriptional regulator [Clostridia bacterium]|nr:MarR family transcriptional regulator [Clostridia bacterium]